MKTHRRLRVLCLHGYRTNAKVMEAQMAGVRRALPSDTEYTYINGPVEAKGPTELAVEKKFGEFAPFYEWMQLRWMNDNEKEKYMDEQNWHNEWDGIGEYEDTDVQKLVQKFDENGPYDVAIGFSQGAVLMSILSMWNQRRKHKKTWWHVSVCVGAPRVRAVNVRWLFEPSPGDVQKIYIPSIHIFGRGDPLYEEIKFGLDYYSDHPHSQDHTMVSSDVPYKLLLEHDSGHRFPTYEKNIPLYEKMAHAIQTHVTSKRQVTTPSRL